MTHYIDRHSALRARLDSLSLDTYALTNEQLTKIETLCEDLQTRALSTPVVSLLHSDFGEIEAPLLSLRDTVCSEEERTRSELQRLCSVLFSATADFLSAPPLKDAENAWFSEVSDEEKALFEGALLTLTSRCIQASEELIALKTTPVPSKHLSSLEIKLLMLKLTFLLTFRERREEIEEKTEQLLRITEEIKRSECKRKRLSDTALQVALDLLPSLLHTLDTILSDTVAQGELDATEIRALYLKVESIREQLRSTTEPLLQEETIGGNRK